MRDAFPIVAAFGERLRTEQTGWRDAKALLVLVAGSGCWDAAANLADALGVSVDAQEAIYREVYGHRPPHHPTPVSDRRHTRTQESHHHEPATRRATAHLRRH